MKNESGICSMSYNTKVGGGEEDASHVRYFWVSTGFVWCDCASL